MNLQFLWQMSKGVNPIVDEFIFIVQSIPVQSPRSDCFEYLSEKSIEHQNFVIRRVSYRTAQTENISTWAKVRVENDLWSFVVERNRNSVMDTVHILFPKIYNLDTRRLIVNILGIGRLYLITRRLRGQRSIDSLNLTDSIAFYWRALITSYQVGAREQDVLMKYVYSCTNG